MEKEKRMKIENKYTGQKVLTWILAFVVFGFVKVILIEFEIYLGALEMAILAFVEFSIAYAICKKINKNQQTELDTFDRIHNGRNENGDNVSGNSTRQTNNMSLSFETEKRSTNGGFYGEDMSFQETENFSTNCNEQKYFNNCASIQ